MRSHPRVNRAFQILNMCACKCSHDLLEKQTNSSWLLFVCGRRCAERNKSEFTSKEEDDEEHNAMSRAAGFKVEDITLMSRLRLPASVVSVIL